MRQPTASPIRTMYSMAFSLGTGIEPGWPRHTGQTFVLGGAPNSFLQPQNIFVRVASSTWHSSPMTVSYASTAAAAWLMAGKRIGSRPARSPAGEEDLGADRAVSGGKDRAD